MKIKEIKTADYLSASKLPASDYVINPYVGCPHACKYCYACFMKRFTGHDEEWGTFLDVKRCDKPIHVKKIENKSVFLSSVTDCYNQYEEKYGITRMILEQLVGVACSLDISTKSKLILRDLDLLKKMNHLQVSMSINTLDDGFRSDMDNASSIRERLETLKILHENGIKTILFLSPIFPYITDFREILEYSQKFIDVYWFENLNLRGGYKKVILDYIKMKYPQFYEGYIQIYLKKDKSYWVELSQEIEIYCAKENIQYVNYFYHEELVKNKEN
ncbi:MAG: radical SAM protein [Lachnospiraceae bacterium]|nr:radical SAM protein [Lachnospiraceae bacterium]